MEPTTPICKTEQQKKTKTFCPWIQDIKDVAAETNCRIERRRTKQRWYPRLLSPEITSFSSDEPCDTNDGRKNHHWFSIATGGFV